METVNNIRLVIFMLASILMSISTHAQFNSNSQIGRGWKKELKENRQDKENRISQVKVVKIETLENINTWTAETKYFRDIQIDSLWYVGVGDPINEKTALKMDTVYRLSMKLNNGKYMHVESLSNGLPNPAQIFKSQLLPIEKFDYSTDLDSMWVANQNYITQIYQYPSTGNYKACELVYDRDNNLIHTESIEFITDGRAIIIYNDSMGNLINLTDTNRYKNGTIVIVDFSDGKSPLYTVSDIGGWPIQIRSEK